MKNLDYTTKLLIYGLPEMKKRERNFLTKWLRRLADEIDSEDPKIFAHRFTAKIMK